MTDKPPPSTPDDEAPEGARAAGGGKVADLDAARLSRQRKRTQENLRTQDMDVRAQIRALSPGKPLMGIPPGKWDAKVGSFGLPPHCPVQPLGRDGDDFFFLNACGGISTLGPSSAGKAYIDALFAPCWNYLVWAWGRVTWSKDGPIYQANYDAEKARVALFEAATLKGPWNMVDNVRGRGAWRADDGSLILHVGNALLMQGRKERSCGEFEGKLYPMQPPTPRPARAEQPAGPESCGRQALDLLATWKWARGRLDAKLTLGWCLAAMVGGALDWRPTIFVTGDKSTGKSTLQKVINALLGDAVIHSVETTAAGIYQVLRHDSLPVAVDELEADADLRKVKAVIELARVASSGGRMLRGGQDHHGRQFDLRSPFFFSAINAPALQPQDRSRMALLELRPLDAMKAGPSIDLSELRQTGTELLRRVIDWWPRIPELLAVFRAALMERAGHDGRGGDTFGALAAFAHIALSDDMPADDELDAWARDLNAAELSELEAATPNWKLCLRHLLQVQPDVYRTYAHKSVGTLLSAWRDREVAPGEEQVSLAGMAARLGNVGLGLVYDKGRKGDPLAAWIVVPNDHSALNLMFRDTKWQGMHGAPGVWTTALRQSPEWNKAASTGVHRKGGGRVGGAMQRGTLIRLATLFEEVGEGKADDEFEG